MVTVEGFYIHAMLVKREKRGHFVITFVMSVVDCDQKGAKRAEV